MIRTIARRGAVGAVAGLVVLAGASVPASATPAAPLDDAGGLIGWGSSATSAARDVPDELQGTAFSAVSAQREFTVALTAAGRLFVIGDTSIPGAVIQDVPASLTGKTITAIATGSTRAAAVTSEGKVAVWGESVDGPDPTDVPSDLSGVKDIDLAGGFAVALKTDGTVVAWGQNDNGETNVPAGLTGVRSIAVGNAQTYALKADGTVVAWGRNVTNNLALPAAVTTPGNVTAIAARNQGGLALLTDGSLVSWGQSNTASVNGIPTALAGKHVVAIATAGSGTHVNAAVDVDGVLYVWGLNAGIDAALRVAPTELAGSDVEQISLGDGNNAFVIATEVLQVTKPAISGTVTEGQTLTGTPGTFSGDPDSVTNTWLADGVEIAGATGTTFTPTAAQVGKAITFASTAAKSGVEPVVSISDPTTAVPPGAVATTTSISVSPTVYGTGRTATVTVGNGAGRPVTGTVTLSGAGAAQTAAVAGGTASFALAKSLPAGGYTLTASYSGGSGLNASSGTAGYSVGKGKSKKPTFKTSKAPTSKKKGKATVTVAANSGLAKATGKVTITLKKGKTSKTVNTTLSGGKRSISLPKLKKGTWKVTVTYKGDRNYVAQKSTASSLKIKK